MIKDLTEKESWYKENDEEPDEKESPKKRMRLENVETETTKNSKTRKRVKRKTKNIKKNNIKSVLFIPHTNNSELAKALREKETKMEDITGNKVKIVERGGKKLIDILSNKDPWRGQNCGRENCLLCATKILTGKNLQQECTKRNIIYEIKCITCEEAEIARIVETHEGDKEKIKSMKEKITVAKYIGETSRSAYERGLEHLDNLASLSTKSPMLRHILEQHEGCDFSGVKWGMKIVSSMRTAFERQIGEAVLIQKEVSKSHMLNSRAEWNQSSLPKITTKMSDNEMEKEL